MMALSKAVFALGFLFLFDLTRGYTSTGTISANSPSPDYNNEHVISSTDPAPSINFRRDFNSTDNEKNSTTSLPNDESSRYRSSNDPASSADLQRVSTTSNPGTYLPETWTPRHSTYPTKSSPDHDNVTPLVDNDRSTDYTGHYTTGYRRGTYPRSHSSTPNGHYTTGYLRGTYPTSSSPASYYVTPSVPVGNDRSTDYTGRFTTGYRRSTFPPTFSTPNRGDPTGNCLIDYYSRSSPRWYTSSYFPQRVSTQIWDFYSTHNTERPFSWDPPSTPKIPATRTSTTGQPTTAKPNSRSSSVPGSLKNYFFIACNNCDVFSKIDVNETSKDPARPVGTTVEETKIEAELQDILVRLKDLENMLPEP